MYLRRIVWGRLMMKKRYLRLSIITMTMVSMLSGCGVGFPDMTAQEQQRIGEYAATLLLKYDANNRSRLMSREDVEAAELRKQQLEEARKELAGQGGKDDEEDTPVIEIGQPGSPVSDGDITQAESFLGLPQGVELSYQGKTICDSYPEDGGMESFFTLDAAEGRKLLVLDFRMENTTQEAQMIDLLSMNAIMRVNLDGKLTRNALVTMLEEDLSTYRGEIPAGETVDAVLLVEVEEDMADSISTLQLSVKMNGETCTILLQ